MLKQSTPDEAGPPKRSVTFLAQAIGRASAKAIAEALAPLGLAPAQYMVLAELWKAERMTQRDLARRLDVEQATMANTLARMARDGLIERIPHPGDSRAALVGLTAKALALRKPAKAAVRAVNARALDSLSKKEQDRFVDALQRVIAALKSGTPPIGDANPATDEP